MEERLLFTEIHYCGVMLLDYKQIATDLIVVWQFQNLPGVIFGQDTKFIEG